MSRAPSLALLKPHLAPLFNCGQPQCDKETQNWIERWNKWRVALVAEQKKRKATKCDMCFKMVALDQIHR